MFDDFDDRPPVLIAADAAFIAGAVGCVEHDHETTIEVRVHRRSLPGRSSRSERRLVSRVGIEPTTT